MKLKKRKTHPNRLKRRISAIDKDLELCKSLSDIWSPKNGLISLHINLFIDNLKNCINNILYTLWNESLSVYDMGVKEEGFPITIFKDGEIIGDAQVCSDGEKATITCAISLSIMDLNIRQRGAYNILRLDEIDGQFDRI